MNCHHKATGCFIIAILACIIIFSPGISGAGSGSVDVKLAASADDAEESLTGFVTLGESYLDLGGMDRKVGLRFAGVEVPKGVTITRAYIEFTAVGGDAASATYTIKAQSSDDAPAFAADYYDISSRALYSTEVEWTVDYEWSTYAQVHQTAELKDIVQLIVTRAGWSGGQAMAFVITGPASIYRRASAYDHDPAKAPVLHIEYEGCVEEYRISASIDDVSARYNPDGYWTTTTTNYFGNHIYYPYRNGLRFTGINIPQGAVINRAYIIFTASSTSLGTAYNTGTGYVTIHGEKTTSPPQFPVSGYSNFMSRFNNNKTTQKIDWQPTKWTPNGTYKSADISNIVQEILGQPDWDISDQSLVLFIGEKDPSTLRYAYSYDNDPNKAPVLHIEYKCDQEGEITGDPVMQVSETAIGRSCWEGETAQPQHFILQNSGSVSMQYAGTVTYHEGSGWLSVSPTLPEGSPYSTLGAGEELQYALNFDSSGLAPGAYQATLTMLCPDCPAGGSIPIVVSLVVQSETQSTQCGDVPLYTREVSSPAVMVLVDLSDSMNWDVDILDEHMDMTPYRTPDISNIVQEVVNRDGWVSENAISFLFEKTAGTGYRHPRAYDGYSGSAPELYVEYDYAGESHQIVVKVNKSSDDGAGYSPIPFTITDKNIKIASGGNGYGAAVRFENVAIPKDADVTYAHIQFIPSTNETTPITVRISAEAKDNSNTFTTGLPLLLYWTSGSESVSWDIPPWTGIMIESRLDVAKSVLNNLVADSSVAWGLGNWNATSPWSIIDNTTSIDGYMYNKTYTKIDAGCKANSFMHQARLRDAIAAMGAGNSTPFAPSLQGGLKYFTGNKAEVLNFNPATYVSPNPVAEDGDFFVGTECQPKVLIEVTDGVGNLDSTVENVTEYTHDLADAGVTVIGVGFGLSESETAQLYALAQAANDRGNETMDDYLFAIHEEDESGNAIPFFANNKEQLIEVFRKITSSVKAATFHGSAPAATTSSDLGEMVLMASFQAGAWTGDLEAIRKDAYGNWSQLEWRASENIPATRSVWTYDSASGQVVAYTDATIDGDNYLCKDLGDIINSTPVVVAAPPFFYPFDDYDDFMVDRVFSNPREAMVYVGSNDGLLHAFSLETGEEKWAFLPHFLHDKLSEAGGDSSKDMCSGGYCYRHLLDGSAQPADVYAKFGGSDDQWRTVLIIGQREGGDAYLALDVTSGESFDPGNPDPAKWLWEFTDSELGQTWSKPSVERVAVADVTGEPTADRTWGVFFSSGYAIDDSQQAAKQAYVYGIVADDKSDLWKNEDGTTTNRIKVSKPSAALYYKDMTKPFYPNTILEGAPSGASATIIAVETTGATSGILTLENVQGVFQNSENLTVAGLSHAKADGTLQNIVGSQSNDALASPLLVDEDGSYTADRIYVGNLYGTMFRIQDIGKGQAPAVSKLFQFDPYPSTPDVNPVRGMAAYAYACNDYGSYCSDNDLDVWVYWGTGKYEDQADQSNQDVQYFFGVKEDDSTTYSLEDLNIGQAEFASATVGSVNYTIRYIGDYIQENAGDNPSWAVKLYVDASGGSERVLTAPLVVGKIAFFTTFIPDSNVCTGSGDTYVFAVEYLTGKAPTYPVFDLNGDGKFTDADKVEVNGEMIVPVGLFVGRGQGSQPVLHKDTLFITTTVADYQMGSPGGEPTGLVAKKVNIPDSRIRTEAWRQN